MEMSGKGLSVSSVELTPQKGCHSFRVLAGQETPRTRKKITAETEELPRIISRKKGKQGASSRLYIRPERGWQKETIARCIMIRARAPQNFAPGGSPTNFCPIFLKCYNFKSALLACGTCRDRLLDHGGCDPVTPAGFLS